MQEHQTKTITYRLLWLPTLIALSVLGMIIYQYSVDFNDRLEQEYQKAESAILRTAKVLDVLNFTIATNFQKDNQNNSLYNNHKINIGDDMCQIVPINEARNNALFDVSTNLRADYIAVAKPDFCSERNQAYQKLLEKLTLAPMLSFLNSLDPFSTGMYFVSTDSFALVSPKVLGQKLTIDKLDEIKERHYWKVAEQGAREMRIEGPNVDVVTGLQILTVSVPVYNKDKMIGLNLIDIVLDELIDPLEGYKTRNIYIGDPDKGLDFPNPYQVRKLNLGNIVSNQVIYINWSFKDQFIRFIKSESTLLIALIVLYLISSMSLIYWQFYNQRDQYSRLSAQDVMTGLLNRRGFETAYDQQAKLSYQALGSFDIDDFKSINDTFGHDVGDEVIVFVADVMAKLSHSRDLVARFGGEEFVIYATSDDKQELIELFEKVRQVIETDANLVLERGFTVSCGLCISKPAEHVTLAEQIKASDVKLYDAKQQGKNQVQINDLTL